MNNIETTVFLHSGDSYTQIFDNEFELDTYFEDNQHIIKSIKLK